MTITGCLASIPTTKVASIKKGLSTKVAWGLVFLTIFFSLSFLIYELNAYTADIYFIHSSKKEMTQLSQENKIMEVELAKANSLWNIEKYAQNFERAEKVEYIRILENTALAK